MNALRIAYGANIFILVPVCWSMYFGQATITVFQGAVDESSGLRLLVAALWTAILLGSAAGLVAPQFFAPLLLVQIVYKALWLTTFVLPRLQAGETIPTGISLVFLAIVLIYPILLWIGLRS